VCSDGCDTLPYKRESPCCSHVILRTSTTDCALTSVGKHVSAEMVVDMKGLIVLNMNFIENLFGKIGVLGILKDDFKMLIRELRLEEVY